MKQNLFDEARQLFSQVDPLLNRLRGLATQSSSLSSGSTGGSASTMEFGHGHIGAGQPKQRQQELQQAQDESAGLASKVEQLLGRLEQLASQLQTLSQTWRADGGNYEAGRRQMGQDAGRRGMGQAASGSNRNAQETAQQAQEVRARIADARKVLGQVASAGAAQGGGAPGHAGYQASPSTYAGASAGTGYAGLDTRILSYASGGQGGGGGYPDLASGVVDGLLKVVSRGGSQDRRFGYVAAASPASLEGIVSFFPGYRPGCYTASWTTDAKRSSHGGMSGYLKG